MEIDNIKIDINNSLITIDCVKIKSISEILNFLNNLSEEYKEEIIHKNKEHIFNNKKETRFSQIKKLKPGIVINFITQTGAVKRTIIGKITIGNSLYLVVNLENNKSLTLKSIKHIKDQFEDNWFLTLNEIDELIEENKISLVNINDFISIEDE